MIRVVLKYHFVSNVSCLFFLTEKKERKEKPVVIAVAELFDAEEVEVDADDSINKPKRGAKPGKDVPESIEDKRAKAKIAPTSKAAVMVAAAAAADTNSFRFEEGCVVL